MLDDPALNQCGVDRTMTSAGPTRSFGPPPEGVLVTEDVTITGTKHKDYFRNYMAARQGRDEFLVKTPETRRVLRVMDAVRESAAAGQTVPFE